MNAGDSPQYRSFQTPSECRRELGDAFHIRQRPKKRGSGASSNLGSLAHNPGSPFLVFLTKTAIGLYGHSGSLLSSLIPETRTDQHPSG